MTWYVFNVHSSKPTSVQEQWRWALESFILLEGISHLSCTQLYIESVMYAAVKQAVELSN